MMEKMNLDKYFIEDHYPLDKKYRLFKPIELEDDGTIINGYGPYGDGIEDYDFWEDVVRVYTPKTRIFARLPVEAEDAKRAIKGNKPYIVVTENYIEKKDKPFGYGTSDYWCLYRFTNMREKEAQQLIQRLI
jgi:hypothetical protein